MADIKVGQEWTRVDGPITRDQIKAYGKASGDRNPIHMDEDFAMHVGLKGVIAHGMLFFGFINRLISDIADEVGGSVNTSGCQMRGSVRPGDWVVTKVTVDSIEDGVAKLSVDQQSKMPLKLEKDGAVVETYEGETRGWVADKEKDGVTTEETDDGTLTVRYWVSIKGTASVKL